MTQVRKARGRGRSRRAIDDVVIGTPEIKAANGRVIQPARPGLIDRMDNVEAWQQTVDDKLDDQTEKLDKILGAVNGHDDT